MRLERRAMRAAARSAEAAQPDRPWYVRCANGGLLVSQCPDAVPVRARWMLDEVRHACEQHAGWSVSRHRGQASLEPCARLLPRLTTVCREPRTEAISQRDRCRIELPRAPQYLEHPLRL